MKLLFRLVVFLLFTFSFVIGGFAKVPVNGIFRHCLRMIWDRRFLLTRVFALEHWTTGLLTILNKTVNPRTVLFCGLQ